MPLTCMAQRIATSHMAMWPLTPRHPRWPSALTLEYQPFAHSPGNALPASLGGLIGLRCSVSVPAKLLAQAAEYATLPPIKQTNKQTTFTASSEDQQMALAKFQPDEIVAAGRQLEAEGVKVNGWNLRDKLGGGRPDRLEGIWKEAMAQGSTLQINPLPQNLQDRIQSALEGLGSQITAAFAEVYQQLAAQSAAQVAEAEERLAQEQIRFDQEAAAASNELERLEAVIADHEAKEKAAVEQLQVVSDNLQDANLQLAQALERCMGLEAQNKLLAADVLLNQGKTEEAQQALSEQALLLGAANQHVAGLQAQVQKLDAAILDARRNEQAAREREATLNGQLASLQTQRLEDARVVQELRQELSQALSACGSLTTKLEAAQVQMSILQTQVKDASDQREADRQQIESLTKKLKGGD